MNYHILHMVYRAFWVGVFVVVVLAVVGIVCCGEEIKGNATPPVGTLQVYETTTAGVWDILPDCPDCWLTDSNEQKIYAVFPAAGTYYIRKYGCKDSKPFLEKMTIIAGDKDDGGDDVVPDNVFARLPENERVAVRTACEIVLEGITGRVIVQSKFALARWQQSLDAQLAGRRSEALKGAVESLVQSGRLDTLAEMESELKAIVEALK